jgi:hypothetical protein
MSDQDRHELLEIIKLMQERLDLQATTIKEYEELVNFLEDRDRPRSFEITQVS